MRIEWVDGNCAHLIHFCIFEWLGLPQEKTQERRTGGTQAHCVWWHSGVVNWCCKLLLLLLLLLLPSPIHPFRIACLPACPAPKLMMIPTYHIQVVVAFTHLRHVKYANSWYSVASIDSLLYFISCSYTIDLISAVNQIYTNNNNNSPQTGLSSQEMCQCWCWCWYCWWWWASRRNVHDRYYVCSVNSSCPISNLSPERFDWANMSAVY